MNKKYIHFTPSFNIKELPFDKYDIYCWWETILN